VKKPYEWQALKGLPDLYRLDRDRAELHALLAGSDLCVSRVSRADDGVAAKLRRDDRGLPLRFLPPEDEELIRVLSEAVSFLPKVSWRGAHTDMLLKGFRSGKWRGLGLLDPRTGSLVSYLDYALAPEGREVEIGFCMSHADWRGQGLVTRLIASLILLYFDHRFRISTHESNHAMSRALQPFGFVISTRLPGDRINGETTLYLDRRAWRPFSLER